MKTAEKSIQLFIGGMSCVNCQNKIEKKLRGTDGILLVRVSYGNGMADITFDARKISLDSIKAAIEELGYTVLTDKNRQKPDLVRVVCMLVIILSLYVMLQTMGILNLLAPGQLADTKMSYGMLFVIGILTSVHCVAMCGGINLSQCIPRGTQSKGSNRFSAYLPALSYNLGRVISYTVIGGILGLLGSVVGKGTEPGLSALLQGILKTAAGVCMVIMGINMLGLFPWLRRFTFHLPAVLRRGKGPKRNRPLLVGICNGLMPCGPLQSMWIVAFASGGIFSGALSMLLFSLGTVPLMLGLGSVVAALGKRFTEKVMTVGAVLVVTLGLAMLSQGVSLGGWFSTDTLFLLLLALCVAGVLFSIPVTKRMYQYGRVAAILVMAVGILAFSEKKANMAQDSLTSPDAADLSEDVQIVNSTLSSSHYPDITVQANVPVRWVIDAPEGSINGCNYKMVIREYGITCTFQPGENVIEFIPTEAKTVQYSCWMGMIRGTISVTDEKQIEGDKKMEILINHWHCILPILAIVAAIFLMRNKDDVSVEKKREKEKKSK